MDLIDFFNKQYVRYADYRTNQRLPNYDGLIETQRKVLYTFLNQNKVNKERSITLMADVMKYTHYNHGDKSVINVINSLVSEWQNNIPLFSEDGQFGNRSNRRASDARYTYTRLKKYTKLLFNEIDNNEFITKQFDADGNEVEPLTLIPILPLLLINGNAQIGVGFASKTLSRKPEDIISLLKNILNGETKSIPNTITPWIWSFKGEIIPNKDNNVSWTFKGKIKKGKSNILIIEEIPFKFNREQYLNKLNKLKKVEKILSYKENINENKFYIEVKVDKKIYDLPEKKLIDLFDLEANESEFINVINENNEIITDLENVGQYLYRFIKWRLTIYDKRKKYILNKMEYNRSKYLEIIRFITQINNNEINIHKQTKKNIEQQIIDNNYKKIDNSYNYLLQIAIYELTEEEINNYKKELDQIEKDYNELNKKKISQLWLEDIIAFEKVWDKEKHY